MDSYTCNVSSSASFSSTLLDAICRALDEDADELVDYEETARRKQHITIELEDKEEMAYFEKLHRIEEWMEKESENVVVRRGYLANFVPKEGTIDKPEALYYDLSRRGAFESYETDECVFAVPTNRPSSFSCYGLQKPKHEGGFQKTKTRASKIYEDLRKAKQPVSSGGKLASFLNSIFSARHDQNAPISLKSLRSKQNKRGSDSVHASPCENKETVSEGLDEKANYAAERGRKSRFLKAIICSSMPSSSKSCNNKAPFSSSKLFSSDAKRSVRLYPVSVIVDEECQPNGNKYLHEEKTRLEGDKDTRTSIYEELEFDLRSSTHEKNHIFINEDEDFDALSCSSSDLFELDNLSIIGTERYIEELPVYETTHSETKGAIVNDTIL